MEFRLFANSAAHGIPNPVAGRTTAQSILSWKCLSCQGGQQALHQTGFASLCHPRSSRDHTACRKENHHLGPASHQLSKPGQLSAAHVSQVQTKHGVNNPDW
ncbi:hypothetical protein Celaphus_00007194 [Cervus elaphus hippelaphus]|uniref:Uncharacterized protein n=1 Tax=Cervus elaphus hippelaphus TaxID=46360 RepID=A0A212CYA2_CEREH|nr:hypothetical protein Celaphus_00007194 [Cervus elaphus hippelaphus]